MKACYYVLLVGVCVAVVSECVVGSEAQASDEGVSTIVPPSNIIYTRAARNGGSTHGDGADSSSDRESETTTITFGSCSKSDREQPLWPHIIEEQPDVFAWLGDIVYTDRRVLSGQFVSRSLEEIEAIYAAQLEVPGFQQLQEDAKVVAVWDDHDFGQNNGGKDFAKKDDVQNIFLDFLGEPEDSPRRTREGVYDAYRIVSRDQPAREVHLILLDNRYHRTEGGDGPDADMLGSDQWAWLEAQLAEESAAANASVTVVGTGLQVLPIDRPGGEKWYEASRARLLSLLHDAAIRRKGPVVLLTGDVHYSELLWTCTSGPLGKATEGGSPDDEGHVRIVEITSSGMTHSCEDTFTTPLCHLAMWMGYEMSAFSLPSALPSPGDDPPPRPAHRELGMNYGVVRVHWDGDGSGSEPNEPFVSIEVHNHDGEAVLRHRVPLGEKGLREAVRTDWTCPEDLIENRGRLALGILVCTVLVGVPTLFCLAKIRRRCCPNCGKCKLPVGAKQADIPLVKASDDVADDKSEDGTQDAGHSAELRRRRGSVE